MSDIKNYDFKKSDFLTPKQVATKLNLNEQDVIKTMKVAFLKGTTILVHAGFTDAPRPLVMHCKYAHANKKNDTQFRLHPLGLDKFKEIFNKGK